MLRKILIYLKQEEKEQRQKSYLFNSEPQFSENSLSIKSVCCIMYYQRHLDCYVLHCAHVSAQSLVQVNWCRDLSASMYSNKK